MLRSFKVASQLRLGAASYAKCTPGTHLNRTSVGAMSVSRSTRVPLPLVNARFHALRYGNIRLYSSEKSKDTLRRLAGHDKDRFIPTDAEVEDFKKRAEAEQRMYNALMPDLNWGLTHPVTWVLFALCVVLHFYTGYRQRQLDAEKEGKKKEEAALLNKEYVEPSSPKKGWE